MRLIKTILFLFIGLASYSQVCNVCPAGSSLTLQSSYPSTASHQWSCTNGFSSTLQNPTFNPNESCVCYLQVTDTLCIAYDTITVNVCNCKNSPCLGLAYNESTNTLSFTPTGTINSPVATDVLQYKREQQTTWTNVPGGNTLSGCTVKANLTVTPTCTYTSGNFRLGYSASICAGTVMTGWQWRGNDGSAITGSSSLLNDYVSRTPAQLVSAGNGGVLDIFAIVLDDPTRYMVAKIRYSYTGSGTLCTNITRTVISQGFYNYDFEARRITTYSNGCPPDTCNTSIFLPTDQSCQVYGYLARVNFGDGLCPAATGGGALFMNTVNMTSPKTYQWRYNGSNTAFNPPEYQAGGYCLDGRPFGEYCAIVTDANGCVAQDCYQYQNICATTVNITLSGTTLTATPRSCVGTPTYTWRRFQNGSWTNVGTGKSYNTAGVSGQYQVTLTCTGPPSCTAISEYEYINACNVAVSVSVATTSLISTVSGCGGSSITYIWQYWNGSTWSTVQTNTTTSTTNTHSPSVSGLYRILVSCNGCSAQNQASITLPDICASFTTTMTGNFNNICSGQGSTFNRTVSGGSMPYSTFWYVDGSYVSNFTSFTYSPSSPGTYQIQVTVIDNNNCQFTDTRFINVISCCALSTSISPNNTNVCTNTSQTFTRNASGNSGTVTTSWFSRLNSGTSVFEGSGSSITLNKSVSGNYEITASSSDASGCNSTATANMSVNSCTNCDCFPSITNTGGCGLSITASGSTCNLYDFALQYSASGTGWTTVQSGISFSSFNYTPNANGFYRILISRSGCTSSSAQTQVTCVSTACSNQPTVSLASNNTTQCGLTPIVISGTRGGSATSVSFAISGNALGNLSANSSTAANFSVTYTPNAADVNKTLTFTVTTNNPLGSPCVASSATHSINILNNPTPSITSSGGVLCVGQSRNLTATPTGGIWSVLSGNGEIVGSTLTATGTGTIQIQYSLSVGGCSGSTTQNIMGVSVPSAPTTSVNCSGGFGNAVITVTAPTGAGIEYKLNNGAWQSSVTFSGVGNGNQTIFVRNANGCENSAITSVACGCANSPNVVIPANDQQCGISTKTITGSFSGATEVYLTLSNNAGGTLSTFTLTSSPFSITYTPVAGDINKTIIITFTTNNPAGSPCVADIKNYSLAINPLPTAVISGPNAICNGQSATLTASGGSTYSWSNSLGGGATKNVNPTATTTYTVTVTSSQGCQSTATKSVTVNPLPTVSISNTATNLCIGDTRTFTGSPSGGTWSNTGQGSFVGNVYSSSTAGSATITYTYTDGNGCVNTASQTISVIALPTTPTLTQDCSLGFGNGRITVTNPTGLEYSLNGSTWQSSTLFTGLSNGNYTVYVRNTTGCISTNTITLNCGCVGGPTISVSPSSGTTCGTIAKSITGSIGGSATTVSGALSGNAGGSLSGSAFPFTYTPVSGDIGKTIIITFTTNTISGCVAAVGTYTLTVLAPPTASISGPNSFCAGSSIDIVASGGTGYSWSSAESIATKTVSSAGTYTVTVTSSNGCTSTATKAVTSNSLPSVSITAGPSTLCVDQSRSMAGTPVNGVWSLSGVGQLTGNQYTATTAGSATITYTYTDANGCVNSANTTITSVANPIVPTFSVNCTGGSGNGIITVTAPTGAGLEYRLNAGSWQSSVTFSSVSNGSYTLSVRNAAGCENSTIVNVNCGCANEPTLTLSSNSFVCSTNPATITGTFGGSATEVFISENGGGSLSISSSTSSSFSFTYTPAIADIGNIVTITVVTNNPLGAPCVAATKTYLLDVRQLPNAAISGNNTICIGQSTTLTASGGTGYLWSSGETTAAITKSPTSNTTYTVTVTGSNTCTNTSTRTVTVNALPTPSISSSSANICVGETRTLTGSPSGGSWSIVSGTGATINSNILSTTAAGSITVRYTYTNGNNCTNTVDQNLTIVAYPSVPTISTTCTANNTSTVTVTAPTGLEYKLNGGSWQSSTTFTGVADGNHIIYVRNPSGCESQLSFSTACGCLVQPTMTLAANSTTCFTSPKTVSGNVFANATNVTATENGDGSLSTYTYGSSPFSFTYTPTANDVGNTVTITFTANIGSPCTPVTRTYLLQVLPLPTAAITGTNVICSGQSTTFTASGGSTYLWSNGSALASQTLSVAGTYTVTVTASNTCTSTATRSLTVNSLPTPSITSSSANLCTGASRTLTATPSGGTFTVISGTASIIGNVLTTSTAGTVTVQYSYTDGNGCTNTTTQNITFIANPSQPTVNSTCTATNISTVTITPPGSGGPFTYSFNGSAFTSTTVYTSVPNGNHTIVIRNSNNCETSRVFSTNCGCLTNPSITLSSTTGAVCGTQSITVSGNTFNAATQVTATRSGTGVLSQNLFTSSPFSFTYTPSQSDIGTNVTITFTTNNPDGAPCQAATAFYVLTVRAVPNIVFSGNTSICNGQSTTLTASGASTYSWSNSLGSGASKTVSPTATTTYTVTATATNTCTNVGTVTVNVNPNPTINIITTGEVLCNNSTRLLEATPAGGTWTINEGPVGTYIFNNSVIVPGNASGEVGLLYTVTNQFNCTSVDELIIPISVKPSDPVISQSVCNNGLVNVTVTSPLAIGNEFSLDNGAWQPSNVFNNVGVGSHTIRVRNFDGCVSSSNFNVVCATCGCTLTLVRPFNSCAAELSGALCPGYSVQFQRDDGGSWVNIQSNVNGNFVITENGKTYRAILSQTGCPNITTNTITNNFNVTPSIQTFDVTNSGSHSSSGNWGLLGTRFFAASTTLPITRTTSGTIEKTSGTENNWYCPTGAGCNSQGTRLSRSALNSKDKAQFYEFTVPSGITGASIGFSADDDGELCINGVTIFSILSNNSTEALQNFGYWRVIDRTISAGDVIRVKYTDKNLVDNGSGVEIYSQPISVLSTLNTNLPVIYSTRNVTTARYFVCPGGTAPDGTVLNCASPNCKCF